MAVIMAASAYLSRRESRIAPVGVVCWVVRARAPSRASQSPDRRRRVVAVVRVRGGFVLYWVYVIADSMASVMAVIVRWLGFIPCLWRVFVGFVRVFWIFCLSLVSIFFAVLG